jgi:adenine-specific DNA-methyltransferase
MRRLGFAGRLRAAKNTARGIVYFDDFARSPIPNIWDFHGERDPIYVVQTNRGIVERALLMTTDSGDLVLDPTCGSGTTAYVAEQWGRRWITIDTSRVSLTLARTRLMAGRFPYYYLADDYPKAAGLAGDDEIKDHLRRNAPAAESSQDVRKGFVFKRVPHVTLKSIANNDEIDAIHAKWQPQLADLRKQINKAAGQKWQEWEVPRTSTDCADDADSGNKKNLRESAKSADKLLKQYWELRRTRQAEIDASIARKAETEVLYDQPYEDTKRIRVTGPFTVESLSPHRTISVEDKKALAEVGKDGVRVKVIGPDDFGRMILENLRAAGVQTGKKSERLKFAALEPYAGQWIHGRGEYAEKDGTVKRAAVCIGPEHGTVGKELVKLAAIEAVKGVGFDVLIICGFAFDPYVTEEAKNYGKLVVLPCRMNPDLAMGDLLKKTGSANLFMVFGEPDVEIKKAKDPSTKLGVGGKLTVEIRGLDVYDPTTGEIRSSSTDDIACWFIDTNYNGESFFVRHAYFTGADEPYDKLKRALRAEVDEAAWSALYSTISRPFDKPETGKIAIKVINHYGDEVLKVYEV